MFQIVLVGRPNVGKSTLFNRLVGPGKAIVNDQPGVTRDRKYGQVSFLDLEFTLVDTAGIDDSLKGDTEREKRLPVKVTTAPASATAAIKLGVSARIRASSSTAKVAALIIAVAGPTSIV